MPILEKYPKLTIKHSCKNTFITLLFTILKIGKNLIVLLQRNKHTAVYPKDRIIFQNNLMTRGKALEI